MSAGTDQSVGVNTGTGAKVRTIEVTNYVAGVANVVEQQVVSFADEQGNIIPFMPQLEGTNSVLFELRLMTYALLEILEGVSSKKITRQELIDLMAEDAPEQEIER